MARKRRRLPEVLHGHRARALSDTILSLLSPPPSAPEDECRTCGGRGCLGCGGASHLIRTGDNSENVRLMTRGVAVVSEGAPPPLAFRFRNHRAQRLIVRNVMEVMVGKSRHPANVLCNGYRKIGFIQDIHLHEATAAFSRNRFDDHLSLGFDSSTGHAIDQGGKFRKHGRPFSWQRRRKRRLINLSHNPPNSHTITEEGKIEEVEQFLNTNEHHHLAEHLEQYNCDAYKEACDMTDQSNASMAPQNVEARTWISEENMNKIANPA
ncbi:hypothetical protein QJS10_CPB20g00215 [Acorus calamus]|uniref:Uncharacterized protein n=1 Tax=Acorus calamus TaxID=4465 RepID=A0AAV9CFM7_ACOCL|nr:hypothetical protein QJS10_CPB20g00215 [Acorus calamus]